MSFISFVSATTASSSGALQPFGNRNEPIGAGVEPGAGGFAGGVNIIPQLTHLYRMNRNLETSIGVGNSVSHRLKQGDNVPLTVTDTINNPATSITTDHDIDIPAVDLTNDASIRNTWVYLNYWDSNANQVDSFIGMKLECPTLPRTSWICGGSDNTDSSGFSEVLTIQYAQPTFWTVSGSLAPGPEDTNQFFKQVPWAGLGEFGHFVFAFKDIAVGTVFRLALQKNGVDTALSIDTNATGASWAGIYDSATVVPVNPGDLLNWKIERIAGAGTSLKILYALGFTS